MAWSWYFYLPIPVHEALSLSDELDAALEEYSSGNPDTEESLREIRVNSGPILTAAQATETCAADGHPVSRPVLDRLKECTSVVEVDRPDDLDNPFLVSVLKFFTHRAPPFVINWDAMLPSDEPDLSTVELSEAVAARLENYEGLPGFLQDGPPPRSPSEAPVEEVVVRIERVLRLLGRDPLLRRKVEKPLRALPDLTQRYMVSLLEEGPLSLSDSALALEAKRADLAARADELDRMLSAFAADYFDEDPAEEHPLSEG